MTYRSSGSIFVTMAVFPIYRDFLRFLDALSEGELPWEAYRRYYLNLHRSFLSACWRAFGIDEGALRTRVERIKRGDYGPLEASVEVEPPEVTVTEALEGCFRLVPPPEEPEVYLMVGFFSPDAFVIEAGGEPKVGFGLERFRDFGLLGLLTAHEYAHWFRRIRLGFPKDGDTREKLVSEGLAVLFSSYAFPELPPYKLLRLPRARWNWCVENEAMLWEKVLDGTIFEDELPPRAWTYIAYRLAERFASEEGYGLPDLLTVPCEDVLSCK